jgi:hypothetical protein
MPDRTTVDILSLEEFNKTLATRLHEVEAMLTKLDVGLGGKAPKLGTFQDANAKQAQHADLHDQYVRRIGRLKSAILAAKRATNDIIANYTTTEARNHASAVDIRNELGGVDIALSGGPASV